MLYTRSSVTSHASKHKLNGLHYSFPLRSARLAWNKSPTGIFHMKSSRFWQHNVQRDWRKWKPWTFILSRSCSVELEGKTYMFYWFTAKTHMHEFHCNSSSTMPSQKDLCLWGVQNLSPSLLSVPLQRCRRGHLYYRNRCINYMHLQRAHVTQYVWD